MPLIIGTARVQNDSVYTLFHVGFRASDLHCPGAEFVVRSR